MAKEILSRERAVRSSPFAVRVVQRTTGRAAIVYRRMSNGDGRDRLHRVTSLAPLAFTIAMPLLRDGVRETAHAQGRPRPGNGSLDMPPGPFYPLSADWGARIACFSMIAAGLRDADRLNRALGHLRNSHPDEAAWWLGLLTREDTTRALRALRILIEAVD